MYYYYYYIVTICYRFGATYLKYTPETMSLGISRLIKVTDIKITFSYILTPRNGDMQILQI